MQAWERVSPIGLKTPATQYQPIEMKEEERKNCRENRIKF